MDHTISDMYYLQLPMGQATQADIWSNLPSGITGSPACKGLIITPRCDFKHSKSPVLNYLPVISLMDYLLSVACFPHLERAISDARDGLRSRVRPLDLDQLFELNVPIEEIWEQANHLRVTTEVPRSKALEKADTDFETTYRKIQQLMSLLASPQLSLEQLTTALSHRQISNIQRDLIKNNSADTYFLPPCEGLIEVPSLVLLRHIFTCPISVVERQRHDNGSHRGAKVPSRQPAPERLLRLKSPFIESLMSKFASLFTRVGTRDIPDLSVQDFYVVGTR
jgi:hypothetical protein